MNIIYARMEGYDWVSVPSDAVARSFEEMGHTVFVQTDTKNIPSNSIDFVWSPYESVTLLGDYLSQELKCPHIAHIEWLPPWRIFHDCNLEEYRHTKETANIANFSSMQSNYRLVGEAWLRANSKSLSSPARLPMHRVFLGDFSEPFFRYPSIDVKTIERVKIQYSPKRDAKTILTVSRLTPEKRVDLIIEALNLVNTPCIWKVIGDGISKEEIKHRITNKNITVDYKGPMWGWGKFYQMLTSTIHLSGHSAMPPLEAALLGNNSIVIESDKTKEIPAWDESGKLHFGDSMAIFKHNELDKVAKKIEEQLEHPSILKENKTVEKFLNCQLNILPSFNNAENVIKQAMEIL